MIISTEVQQVRIQEDLLFISFTGSVILVLFMSTQILVELFSMGLILRFKWVRNCSLWGQVPNNYLPWYKCDGIDYRHKCSVLKNLLFVFHLHELLTCDLHHCTYASVTNQYESGQYIFCLMDDIYKWYYSFLCQFFNSNATCALRRILLLLP